MVVENKVCLLKIEKIVFLEDVKGNSSKFILTS